MVMIRLSICADLENLTDLQPQGGCADPEFTYLFKMKCGNCGEVTEKETCLSLNETVPSAKGKSDVHLSQKCKFCMREATVTMHPGGHPLTLEKAEIGKYTPLMWFDCRGYEPEGFIFGSGWKAVSIAGTTFDDIDLSGEEYADYDEKGACPVMISNLRYKFDKC